MKIKRFISGNLESNGYVLYQREGGDCYIVDPGYNADQFLTFIRENNLTARGVLLMHHHYDHVGAVKKIRQATDCPVYLHGSDADMYRDAVDVTLADGDKIELEDETITALHTPGHTEGSVCYYSAKGNLAFTGDTIFNVDLGRTDLSDGDPAKMRRSIRDVVNRWDNGLTIYPGHGDPCDMKFVRKVNREFLELIES